MSEEEIQRALLVCLKDTDEGLRKFAIGMTADVDTYDPLNETASWAALLAGLVIRPQP